MTDEVTQRYTNAVAAEEGARDSYQSLAAVVRTWPFNHDAEHQAVDQEALDAVAMAAVALGKARDVRDNAWRAYKKESRR